jgi:hypothetical protein
MNRVDPPYPEPEFLERIPWDDTGHPLAVTIGSWNIAVLGLDRATTSRLGTRWGGFVREQRVSDPDLTLACADCRGGGGLGLGPWREGEVYRLEGALVGGRPVVRSYNFCMAPGLEGGGVWRLVLGGAAQEPTERTVENAVRSLVSRLALQAGGFALHGAGVRRDGQTWIYAGRSGAGKSTAVALSSPCESLGDDFAVAVPADGGWSTCAVPFDNSEQAPDHPVPGLLALGAILRLFHAEAGEDDQVEVPPAVLRAASLLNAVMLPGLFADLGDTVLTNAGRFVEHGRFGHLRFHKDRNFLEPVRSFLSSAGR